MKTTQDFKENKKSRTHDTTKDNNLLVTNPTDMGIYDLTDKNFKIALLRSYKINN